MNDFLNWLDASLIGQLLAVTGAMFALMLFASKIMIDVRKSRYEDKKVHLELDILRSKLERVVYDAAKDLTRDTKNFTDVNHLVLDSTKANVAKSASKLSFFEGLGIDLSKATTVPRTVFVLTPHHDMFEKTYRSIQNIFTDTGYTVARGDENFVSSSILKHVVASIMKAEVVVANIDGRNPNVFYELGIAQTLGKKVIIVCSEATGIPFDLASQRLVLWDSETSLKEGLLRAIARLSIDHAS